MKRPSELSIQQKLRQVRRQLGANTTKMVAGDTSGVILDPANPGMVRVQPYASLANDRNLGQYTLAQLRSDMRLIPGMPVVVRDDNGKLIIDGPDFDAMRHAGNSPLAALAGETLLSGGLDLSSANILASFPYATDDVPGVKVAIKPVRYIRDRVFYAYAGTGSSPVDLSASVPASGNHRAACLFLKTDGTIETQVSTSKALSTPLGIKDLQECITASAVDSLPISAWRLYGDQNTLTDSDFLEDLRQWVNTDAGATREHVLLDSALITSGASLDITSIPPLYDCLILRLHNVQTNYGVAAIDALRFTFNGDVTAANYYSYTSLHGGTTPSWTITERLGTVAGMDINGVLGNTSVSNPTSVVTITIKPASAAYKSGQVHGIAAHGFSKANTTTGTLRMINTGGYWSSTADITTITIQPVNGTAFLNCSYELYGIR